MTLDEYLAERGETLTAFAARVGTSVPTISRACAGKTLPTPPLMRRIFSATGGLVTPTDFYRLRPAPMPPVACVTEGQAA